MYAEMLNFDWTIDVRFGRISNPQGTTGDLNAAIKVIKEFYDQVKAGR